MSRYDRSVRQVPEEQRVSPAPQILGPVIEGIRYEPEGTPIDEMFSELLSRSMDRDRAHEAHPAYPIIIKQISADEARILYRLDGHNFDYVDMLDFDNKQHLFIGKPKIELDALPRDGLVYPENVPFYFEHLHQLGLAGIFQQGNQDAIFGNEPGVQIGVRRRFLYRLTDFGQRFAQACTVSRTSEHAK
jgi:Abortive infection alpha